MPPTTLPPAQWIDAAGIRTCYHEAGSGPPIVFIYGGNFGTGDSASSAYTWALNLLPLADRFRVIAFDKIGQGFTANPPGDDYSMQAVVRHAAAFITALDLPPVHLVGHSRGGYAATRLTLELQSRVRALTIVNSGTLSQGVGTNEVVLSRPPFPAGSREGARWIYQTYCHRPDAVTEDWMDVVMQVLAQPKYAESVRRMQADGLQNSVFLPGLMRDKRETLTWIREGRLQRPTQIIWGSNDRTAVTARGVELFQSIAAQERRTELNLINDSGHFPFREHPERFNALLASFSGNFA